MTRCERGSERKLSSTQPWKGHECVSTLSPLMVFPLPSSSSLHGSHFFLFSCRRQSVYSEDFGCSSFGFSSSQEGLPVCPTLNLLWKRSLKHASPLRIVRRYRCRTPWVQASCANKRAAPTPRQRLQKVGAHLPCSLPS